MLGEKKPRKRDFRKILDHPSVNFIIRELKTKGVGVRLLAKKLKEMYPDDKSKWISFPTLQAFRQTHLKIEDEVLQEIKKVYKEKEIEKAEERDERMTLKKEHTEVKKLPAYKEKIEEAVGIHIDIKQQLANLHTLITARTEAIFDKLAEGKGTVSDEQNLQKYFQTYILTIEKWAKYIDKVADYTVEQNVNITVIEDQMAVLREAVFETIKEMEPTMAVKFLEKLDNKMKNTNYRQDKMTFPELNKDVKVLVANVEEIANDD